MVSSIDNFPFLAKTNSFNSANESGENYALTWGYETTMLHHDTQNWGDSIKERYNKDVIESIKARG